jgi:hypothetical protein
MQPMARLPRCNDMDAGWIRPVAALVVLVGIAGCSTTDPVPSSRFDGYYVGTRVSDHDDVCGLSRLQGRTSARVARGRLSMELFGPRTELIGTVGADGVVRASGIWRNPTGGFPGVTVLNGVIEDRVLEATASDFRCHTQITLRWVPPRRARPVASRHRERAAG